MDLSGGLINFRNAYKAMRFGIAMRMLILSVISQTRSSDSTAPKNIATK